MLFRRAGFGGSFNRSKVKVWLYLAAVKANGRQGATINQIHEDTGVPLLTLRRHMDKWWSWGRIHKRIFPKQLSDGCTCMYSIAPSGTEYINRVVPDAFIEECVSEIKAWQDERRAMRELAEAEHRKRIEALKARLREKYNAKGY